MLTSACSFNKLLAVVLCRHSGRHGDGCCSPEVLPYMGGRVSVVVVSRGHRHTALFFFSATVRHMFDGIL